MMRSFKKIIFDFGLIVSAMAIILIPLFVRAKAASPSPAASRSAKINYCEKATSLFSKVDQKINVVDARLKEKRSEIAARINTRQAEVAASIAEKRIKWDENRAEHFSALDEKAESSAQKQALAIFKKAINEAIVTRRAAIDAANKVFQDGISRSITVRKDSINGVVAAYRIAVSAAFAKAKADCQARDANAVRETLRAELRIASENLNAARQGIEKIKTPMDALIAAHKAAIKKANDDFKLAMEKARADFKAAMAKISPSPAISVSPSVLD